MLRAVPLSHGSSAKPDKQANSYLRGSIRLARYSSRCVSRYLYSPQPLTFFAISVFVISTLRSSRHVLGYRSPDVESQPVRLLLDISQRMMFSLHLSGQVARPVQDLSFFSSRDSYIRCRSSAPESCLCEHQGIAPLRSLPTQVAATNAKACLLHADVAEQFIL